MAGWAGMNWIRQEKRLAIYLRDGLACAWCGHALEAGARLTLDHLTPRSDGGGNDAANLVTACERCNKSRGARPVEEFAAAVAGYLDHGVAAAEIERHVLACAAGQLAPHMQEAKALIARRGSAARVLAAIRS